MLRVVLVSLAVVAASSRSAPPWTDAAREYVEAHRAYFYEGHNDRPGLQRVNAARRELGAVMPGTGELRAALASSDPERVRFAIAALSLQRHPDVPLLDLLLERVMSVADPSVRMLAVEALADADSTWRRERSHAIVRAFATERDSNVAISLGPVILCDLERDDAVRLTTALVVNGESRTHKTLLALMYQCGGVSGVAAVADRCDAVGRPDLAAEARAQLPQRAPGAGER